MRQTPLMLFTITTLILVGCAEEPPAKPSIYSLEPGETLAIEIKSDTPKLVEFGFKKGSESQKAALECPELTNTLGQSLRLCAGLKDTRASPKFARDVKSQFGGGAIFHPQNGKIEVELESFAHQTMKYIVRIKDLSN